MRRYQIAMKPNATASGEPGEWSLRAHGAKHDRADALMIKAGLEQRGYTVKLLPVGNR